MAPSDSYKYLDPNNAYTDPKTGVLKNLLDISSPDVLHFIESSIVTKRIQELYNNPIKITDIESLFEIHKYLFQDIYAWAGKPRTIEISKEGKQFFPISHFNYAHRYINSLINEFRKFHKGDIETLAKKLAEILDSINYLHPFREGNGRAQREFIRILAIEKDLTLNLNPPDKTDVYKKYMKGMVNSDLTILAKLIFELITTER